MRNASENPFKQPHAIHISLRLIILLLGTTLFYSCVTDPDDGILAEYAGNRPLHFLKITQSFTPDIQWVGGRVAAVGVNKGPAAALDSTLVWLMTADGNDINSHVTVGEETDTERILSFGGTPSDSLDDDQEYTFWLADKVAWDAGLNIAERNEFTFIDSTITTRLYLRGRWGGGRDASGNDIATISILRDERLLSDRYIVDWPEGTAFRRVAIRQSSLGGFTDLVWHVVTPDDEPDNITPPIIIGETPPGTDEVTPWPDTGFELNTVYILWMANSDWVPNTFSPSSAGYAWFRLFPITE
jgi:hypothetical protein